MKVGELGEFGLIERLSKVVNEAGVGKGPELLLGIGEDASAWRGREKIQLCTTESLVEGVHFDLKLATWWELGWKSLAVNLSDIAAMGGLPAQAVVSLGLPPETQVEQVVEFYSGMAELAKKFDLLISGGDLTQAPPVIIGLTVLGYAGEGWLLTRSGAKPGELIAVTGYLGSSAAGLQMLKEGLELNWETASFLSRSHLRPLPRINEAQSLVREGIEVAIDVSDGLLSDLEHICKASGVEARIELEKIPVHPLVKNAFGQGSLSLALSGGEDYELLFVGEKEKVQKVKELLPTPVSLIGEVVAEEPGKVKVFSQGELLSWQGKGWEHFKG